MPVFQIDGNVIQQIKKVSPKHSLQVTALKMNQQQIDISQFRSPGFKFYFKLSLCTLIGEGNCLQYTER